MKLVFEPKASLYARFLVWYGGASFLNSLFLFWLLLSFWLTANPRSMDVVFVNDVFIGSFEGNQAMLGALGLTLVTYYLLPFCAASAELPVAAIARHLVISNLVFMQELTNGVYILGRTLLGVKQGWTPMGAGASGSGMWPTGIPCMVISAAAFWITVAGAGIRSWTLIAAPMLICGMLSPWVARHLNSIPKARKA